jgi:FlaA1/EpsC-like NDP-sugar epimerase
MELLSLIDRDKELFTDDMVDHAAEMQEIIAASTFLVIGGAGSIGQAVTKELFKRNPLKLHVVDISENNLVELIRDIRSSFGYIKGDFKTFVVDAGSVEFEAFFEADGHYDYVLNLSALKHVRSEKDPYTLMRMIDVNIINTEKTVKQCIAKSVRKYFCVSTDKAANPVNMMGASKRIMEIFLIRRSRDIPISTARFANVAFSDGSLLHGFNQRIQKKQPIVAPTDIRRYFITPKEAGELCLMSTIFGENRDIFFPKLNQSLHLTSLADIAGRFLNSMGYELFLCASEEEARELSATLPAKKMWPCFFTSSDTTGEKDVEEFFTQNETLDMARFKNIGVIKNGLSDVDTKIDLFERTIARYKKEKKWTKQQLLDLFTELIPDFGHLETGKYLDAKM